MDRQDGLIDVKKVKSLMALKDHKQKDLANMLDIAPQTVNAKLKGHKEFNLREAYIIAKIYGVSIDNLLI